MIRLITHPIPADAVVLAAIVLPNYVWLPPGRFETVHDIIIKHDIDPILNSINGSSLVGLILTNLK